MARPSSYDPEFAKQAEKLCRLGATDIDIARFFEVDVRTIYRWKHDHDEFCQALKRGKDIADNTVEESLFRKATGYTHDAVKIFQNNGVPVIVDYVEHHPPDTTAAIFWLKNRKPELWRDKRDVDVKHDVETAGDTRALARAILGILRDAEFEEPRHDKPPIVQHKH